jgi:methyl-accepting chemotaxis protein
MTIKAKLTLNVVIVIAIVAGVAITSVVGMAFVKSRLQDLTQRSTPFQMRTVEFQRLIQGATADLIKVSASRTRNDYNTFKSEAEKSLSEVEAGQSALQSLSGDVKVEAHRELTDVASELFSVADGRLKADEDALAANKTISERLREATARLKELDGKIKGLQASSSTSYARSMTQTKAVSGKVGNVAALKLTMKDFQLGFMEVVKAQSKKGVLVSQGKCNSALNKALQNEQVRNSAGIAGEIKLLAAKLPALIKTQMSMVGQTAADTAPRDLLVTEITDRVNALNMAIEQEGAMASDNLSEETRKQNSYFGNSALATNVMSGNSELLSLGLNVEGLSTRLFTVSNAKEVDAIESELRGVFARIDVVKGGLARSLASLNARKEAAILHNAEGSLNSIRGLLFVRDGVISKIRNRLNMEVKATAAMVKLRAVVLKQAEKGKQTVSVAQLSQEKAISTVNKMVGFTTALITAIGIGAAVFGILFGIWVYRSISRPLGLLLTVSQSIARGDLAVEIDTTNKDEIGKVQLAMAEMVENLRGMVGKIKGATDTVANSSEELSATVIYLERGTDQQTSRIDQSATAITEMTQTTGEVARNSADTSNVAVNMKNIAERGKQAMTVTVQELGGFVESVIEAAGQVESLGQQSEEISNVVTLINDIADQTNLLALNAAIEAARAGDHGRGFAVVAGNVRDLAERTSTATKEIYETVKAMQSSVQSSVSLMQEERESVARVQGQVQQTLSAIDEIVSYVEQVTDMVQRIAVAAEEQSATSEDVSKNMDGIFQIAKELRTSFSDIKSSSGSLSHLATDLNTMVGWFRV